MKKMLEFDASGGYINYPGKGKITDIQVANLVRSHVKFIDRFSVEKMTAYALYAQNILMGVIEIPKGKWRFKYTVKK